MGADVWASWVNTNKPDTRTPHRHTRRTMNRYLFLLHLLLPVHSLALCLRQLQSMRMRIVLTFSLPLSLFTRFNYLFRQKIHRPPRSMHMHLVDLVRFDDVVTGVAVYLDCNRLPSNPKCVAIDAQHVQRHHFCSRLFSRQVANEQKGNNGRVTADSGLSWRRINFPLHLGDSLFVLKILSVYTVCTASVDRLKRRL